MLFSSSPLFPPAPSPARDPFSSLDSSAGFAPPIASLLTAAALFVSPPRIPSLIRPSHSPPTSPHAALLIGRCRIRPHSHLHYRRRSSSSCSCSSHPALSTRLCRIPLFTLLRFFFPDRLSSAPFLHRRRTRRCLCRCRFPRFCLRLLSSAVPAEPPRQVCGPLARARGQRGRNGRQVSAAGCGAKACSHGTNTHKRAPLRLQQEIRFGLIAADALCCCCRCCCRRLSV